MTRTAAELAHLFRALKAPAAARALPALADRAREESWSYERFAEILLGTEVSARESHGGEGRIKTARFPARKTLEEFDFTFQRSRQEDGDRAPRATRLPARQRERDPARTARSPFTLPSSLSSLVKQSSTFAGYLDSQAFSPPAGDLDRFKLAALDLVQNGLAGASEPLGGLGQGQVAVGNVGHEPRADLVGQPDPPRCVRGGLLAR